MKKRGGNGKCRCLGVELQFLAEDFLLVGIDVVIEEIKEPGDAREGNNDGGPGGRRLLGYLEITAPRVLFEIKVEELVLHLQRLAQQLHVIPSSSCS